jgi:hypothetical protein
MKTDSHKRHATTTFSLTHIFSVTSLSLSYSENEEYVTEIRLKMGSHEIQPKKEREREREREEERFPYHTRRECAIDLSPLTDFLHRDEMCVSEQLVEEPSGGGIHHDGGEERERGGERTSGH